MALNFDDASWMIGKWGEQDGRVSYMLIAVLQSTMSLLRVHNLEQDLI